MLVIQAAPRTVPAPLPAPPPTLSRDLPLQGTHNTRQLGGLPTRGGTIRQNVLFRSDALQTLTPGDVATLKAIPIRTVVDFRVPEEICIDGPDRYTPPNPVSLPTTSHEAVQNPQGYRDLLMAMTPAIQGFFKTLANPQSYPVVYHCHSGKDRTGIATALLLMALGTPRDVIMADYMLSQRGQTEKVVDPSWMQAVFDQVDKAGGIDRFLGARGVTQQELYQVRRYLTQDSRGMAASA